jgi:hypothetical protein
MSYRRSQMLLAMTAVADSTSTEVGRDCDLLVYKFIKLVGIGQSNG